MFAIFKLTLSVCSFLIIGLYYFILNRNKDFLKNLTLKRSGVICSKCSDTVITEDELQKDNYAIIDRQENLTECLACRRESRLNLLVGLSSIKDKFDKWILTKRSERILLFCIIISFPFIVASIFIGDKTFSSLVSITNSCVLITYWSLMIYRIYLCRKPLPDSLN